jgi:hypothetical protein
MPKYLIERQFLIPVYHHLVVEADTPEEACGEAIERDDWSDAIDNYESARATTITAIREVTDEEKLQDLGLSGFVCETGAELIEVPEHFANE